jgi:hypothetical protein
MLYYFIKVLLTAVLVVLVSEVAKRSTLFGALVASLPLTSILAMIWVYVETKDLEKVASLSQGIFWIVIPSLLFFLLFPYLTKQGLGFWTSLGISAVTTGGAYWCYAIALSKVGIRV